MTFFPSLLFTLHANLWQFTLTFKLQSQFDVLVNRYHISKSQLQIFRFLSYLSTYFFDNIYNI